MQSIENSCTIACFGSGGLAWSLLPALCGCGCRVEQVFSRSMANAQPLAKLINAAAIDHAEQYDHNADIAILAIADDAIEAMLPLFKDKNSMVIHTAGAVPLNVFEHKGIKNYGVLYPLQTFTRGRTIDLSGVPIFVEANNDANTSLLLTLAGKISHNVHVMPSDKRLRLHVAAVFAGNFTNHCLTIAADILNEYGMPANIISPLVNETINKALSCSNPSAMQTGPAIRGSHETMQKHLNTLQNQPMLQQLYRLMSQSIACIGKQCAMQPVAANVS
jgi:predicted short-subunit dehydrogenase-like oxidoreductase (DUF2520 family)